MTQNSCTDGEPSTPGGVTRRNFLKSTLGLGLALGTGLLTSGCGSESEAPAQNSGATGAPIRIGFIPLTDCGSVVMASTLGLYEKHGVKVEVLKEASWANVRDKLLTGELDAAHCLFGMPFSVYNGIGGKQGSELKIAMLLNTNGQAITVRQEIAPLLSYGSVDGLKAMVEQLRASKEPTFAMTFPGGTHDLWMRYWLGAGGLKNDEVKLITIPPPQMVANMKVGSMDAFCVGEPWGGVAVKDGIGATAITTQDLWEHHPEKALVVNANFAATRREDLKKVMKAVLEASSWLDTMSNRAEAAKVLGGQAYVNAPVDVLEDRLEGTYNLGAGFGERSFSENTMRYHFDGKVNFPRKAHAIWFMAQYVRFGMLQGQPDVQKIADQLIMQDLYAEVAGEMKIAVPDDDMKPFTIKLDNATFDPNDPWGSISQYVQ